MIICNVHYSLPLFHLVSMLSDDKIIHSVNEWARSYWNSRVIIMSSSNKFLEIQHSQTVSFSHCRQSWQEVKVSKKNDTQIWTVHVLIHPSMHDRHQWLSTHYYWIFKSSLRVALLEFQQCIFPLLTVCNYEEKTVVNFEWCTDSVWKSVNDPAVESFATELYIVRVFKRLFIQTKLECCFKCDRLN